MSTPSIRAALEQWRDLAQTDLLCPTNPAETDWGAVVVAIAATRAALAQPEGEGPTDEELQRFYDESLLAWGKWRRKQGQSEFEVYLLRAALARWGRPAAPPAPEVGEVVELAAYLQDHGTWLIQSGYANASIETRDLGIKIYRHGATLLQQLPTHAPAVVPVVVSERLPGPEDCDEDGFCWMGYGYKLPGVDEKDSYAMWMLMPSEESSGKVWAPASAIPLPQAGEVL